MISTQENKDLFVPQFITRSRAAEIFGVSRRSLSSYEAQGLIRGFKIPQKKLVRYRFEDLKLLILGEVH